MLYKRINVVAFICLVVCLMTYANAAVLTKLNRDTVLTPEMVKQIAHSKDVAHSNARRIFNMDSVYNSAMQKEILASLEPGYKSPEIVAKEARKHMNDEMIKDGLIETGVSSNLRVSSTEFIVNGIKQPDSVFKKYKALWDVASSFTTIKSTYLRNHLLMRLMIDGIIGTGNFDIVKLSYNLTRDAFVVNGVTQLLAVAQKYFKDFGSVTQSYTSR